MDTLDRLAALLSKLPGIGKKTANRLTYYILDAGDSYARSLAEELANLHRAVKRCSRCGNFTEQDPCPICGDISRDRGLLCVVERAQDIRVIEESREYRGLFHVLGGLIAPLEGVNPGDLSIGKLRDRIRGEQIREVILALNPTIEGDTTALYLRKILQDTDAEISRLASGLPVGGDLEYTDRLTLSRSFRGRVKI
jgi:recombination protein RecR